MYLATTPLPSELMYRQRLLSQAAYSLLRARAPILVRGKFPSVAIGSTVPPQREVRHNSSTPTSPPPPNRKPKKLSPYRLIPPHTFLAEFAPLHVAGWRLDHLPSNSVTARTTERSAVEEGMADLQDRRLVRLYEFEMSKEGWEDCMKYVKKIGDIVAKEDVSTLTPSLEFN